MNVDERMGAFVYVCGGVSRNRCGKMRKTWSGGWRKTSVHLRNEVGGCEKVGGGRCRVGRNLRQRGRGEESEEGGGGFAPAEIMESGLTGSVEGKKSFYEIETSERADDSGPAMIDLRSLQWDCQEFEKFGWRRRQTCVERMWREKGSTRKTKRKCGLFLCSKQYC